MLLFRNPAWRLWFLWVKLWWSLSCMWWQDSSSIAFCCSSTQVPSWSSSAHWINPHSFPCHFLLRLYPWLLIPSPLQKSSVFSHSPFTPYLFPSPFHSLYFRNSWAAFLFEYGRVQVLHLSWGLDTLILAFCLNLDSLLSYHSLIVFSTP